MANSNENFMLVEVATIPCDVTGAPKQQILGVIRSYLSNSRAVEDLDLMREILTDRQFAVVSVEHIDN